jgi:hypothetical protein
MPMTFFHHGRRRVSDERRDDFLPLNAAGELEIELKVKLLCELSSESCPKSQ